MPGGRNTVGVGVRVTDDRRRAFLLGDAAFLGTVYRARGGYGDRVACSPSTDVAQ